MALSTVSSLKQMPMLGNPIVQCGASSVVAVGVVAVGDVYAADGTESAELTIIAAARGRSRRRAAPQRRGQDGGEREGTGSGENE